MSQEVSLDWGGYYQIHMGFVDAGGTAAVGEDVGGFDMFSDGEIHFKPSITLDNGITVGARVELEAQADSGSMIDHTFVTVSSDTLGTIQMGNLNGVAYNTGWVTPGVGSIGVNSGTMSQFIPLLEFPTAHRDLSNDRMKINYSTPSFNGFSLGLEYTPSTQGGNSRDNGVIDRNVGGNTYDIWGVAANYSQSFGTSDITLHASYQTGDESAIAAGDPTFSVAQADNTTGDADITPVGGGASAGDPFSAGDIIQTAGSAAVAARDPEILRVGAALGFGATTIGGNYESFDSGAVGGAGDVETWTFGMSYDIAGPWTVGFDMIQADYDNGAGVPDSEETAFRLGAARDLGPGVTWDMNAIMYEGDDKATPGTDRDGTILVSTLTFKF